MIFLCCQLNCLHEPADLSYFRIMVEKFALHKGLFLYSLSSWVVVVARSLIRKVFNLYGGAWTYRQDKLTVGSDGQTDTQAVCQVPV